MNPGPARPAHAGQVPRPKLERIALAAIVSVALVLAPSTHAQTLETRSEVIARAQVWSPTNIPAMNMRQGPQGPDAFAPGETVVCDYLDKKLDGNSRKLACRLDASDAHARSDSPDGQEVKVKFGAGNGEVEGEVAATRLLWALGFGADRMYPVRVICRGCPPEFGRATGRPGERLIEPAVIERRLPSPTAVIPAGGDAGWSWPELDLIDEKAGGAPRAHRDALKLLAVMLQHTDSKPEQQRLICLDESSSAPSSSPPHPPSPPPPSHCTKPFLMVNDLGLTFGRASLINANDTSSVNLREWTATPIWKGLLGCVGNLPKSLSGTLKDPPISDDGRRFLAGLLLQLSDQQLRALFSVAHMDARTVTTPESGAVAASVDDWVRAFTAKRDEIVQRRCFDTWSSTAPPGFGVEPNVWLQMRATPGRTNAMNAVSFLGYNAVYVVLAVALTVTWRLRAGAALLVLLALNGMVTNAAKSVVAYPRPDAVDTRVRTIAMLAPVNVEAARQGVVKALPERTIGAVANALDTAPSAPTVDDNVYGFPSGHVSAAAAFLFGLVFFFGWRWAWLGMAIWVPLMAVSRLYLGRHFAADVLGGFAVSVIVTALAVMALNLARLARGTKEYRVRHVGRRLVITAAMLAVSALIIGVPRAPDAGTLLGLAIGILPLLRDPGADEVTWPIRLARFAGAAIAFGVVWFGVRFALSALPAWRGPAVDLVAAALPVAVLFPSMLLIGRHVTRGRQPINASSNTAAH